MRIGVFEVDFTVRSILSIAEVFSGEAPIFRALSVKNIRGSERDWLNISAVIGGIKTKQISIRQIPVYGSAADNGLGYHINNLNNAQQMNLLVPSSLQPGRHEGELMISYSANRRITGQSSGAIEIPFSLNVLPASWIPTDFARAPYLAAWILPADDELREFDADACGELNNDYPSLCVQALYEALIRQNLMYQPVPAAPYPDFQPFSGHWYTLRKGGSCMDLSLLMASLLWIRGLSPVLLLYDNHMTAGCFSTSTFPDFETMENPKQIEDMILQHQLILPEMTGVCSYQQLPFVDSLKQALEWLKKNRTSGCRLVNLKTVLRKGTVRLLPGSFQAKQIQCPICGYDSVPPWEVDGKITCPACRKRFEPVSEAVSVPAVMPDIIYDPRQIRYECRGQVAGVARYLTDAVSAISILSRWKDKPVTYIAEHAFENSGLGSIILPDTITEIKDRAFRGCEKLTSIKLPQNLSHLGSGAFSSSGLESIRIPGSMEKIPVLCFSGCEHLKTVILEDGIREIDSQAFIHCPNLEDVYIPASVKKVSESAFDSSCRLIYTSSRTMLD